MDYPVPAKTTPYRRGAIYRTLVYRVWLGEMNEAVEGRGDRVGAYASTSYNQV